MENGTSRNTSHSLGRISSRKFLISSEAVVFVIIALLLAWYHFVFRGSVTYWLVFIPIIGFGLSLLDSSIGMGFGTIGSPLLIVLGFSSKEVVPSVLVTQMALASVAAAFHQRKKNANYFNPRGNDVGIEMRLIVLGIVGTVIAAFVYLNLSKEFLNIYLGILVICMSAILLLRSKMSFSWTKVNLISVVSGFNKAISGGGYGPVVTTGLIVSGNPLKNSVGATLFSVIFINTTAFLFYLMTKQIVVVQLPIFLTIGSLIGSQIGPSVTGKMGTRGVKSVFACTVIALGAMTIILTLMK